ncbi:MAG TPA: heme biosynthesis HemY N-terminal domain-containing protein, partial [Caulobacteraceae bacterium]|nr:heme biosynthesis HemY N-terminal domain-containing protein [Caulobacteraceae bacterium]
EARRRQGAQALTRGFLAAAAGEGAEARRLATRAAEFADESPQLVRLLAAQAAEADGDRAGARSAYAAMLGFPEMKLAAHRGQMTSALADGDRAGALEAARAAYGLAHTAPWAWRALFEEALGRADWAGALALAAEGLDRKVISPLVAGRARAALQTAQAAGPSSPRAPGHAGEARLIADAAEEACAAAKARPDFTPAATLAARLLGLQGRSARAAPILEAAWRARPHPALWLAFRDLKTDETPADRARRLGEFAAAAPASREGRILALEKALIAADTAAVQAALPALAEEPTSARLAGVRARAAVFVGDLDEARAWIARAEGAGAEPEWSDIDEAGRAFAFSPADWARVISVYAEKGELAHPRFERGEKELSVLPRLPAAYADASPAFVAAAAAGDLYPPVLDDSDFSEDLQPAPAGGPAPAAPRGGFFRGLGGRSKGR